MHYCISFKNPLEHYVDIILTVDSLDQPKIYLQLPAWRPGRYELTAYAGNIQTLQVTDVDERNLPCQKVSTNRWEVITKDVNSIIVCYNYYAYQLDAGGSLLDDQQLYLNFINCLLYVEGRMQSPCIVDLKIPENYQIACGLPLKKSGRLMAQNYYQLVDSPMVASQELRHWKYLCKDIQFHLWFVGAHKLDRTKTIKAFKAFTLQQIETMGSFPEKDYHFIFQTPPFKIYHGVEHANSTVIALGPGANLHKQRYRDLLGVSSHELFHAWNILKIRPKELLPYDLSKESFFESGFIAEGVTTYYGDLFLIRSGVFHEKQYFRELNTLLKRHLENEGRHYASLANSSRDLWLDGYQPGAPGRKVSIYTKGALVALVLDLSIRMLSGNQHSLDDVMRVLWRDFGMKDEGYSIKDYQKICEHLAGQSMQRYFDDLIYSTTPIESYLSASLDSVGCCLRLVPSKQTLKRVFGVRLTRKTGTLQIQQIAPGSAAQQKLSIGDEILKINGKVPKNKTNELVRIDSSLKLQIKRHGRVIRITLPLTRDRFYDQLKVAKVSGASTDQKTGYKQWLNCNF